MRKMGKKYVLALVLLMLFSNVLPVSAGGEAQIYGEDLQVSEGTAWKISVKIQDNPGIMGFRIHMEYPADCLTVLGTERGEVTETGNFTDNAGKNQGSLDVMWNDTAETKENGVLFYVAARLPEGMQDEFTLRLSCLQPDTFNEKWEDVVFECHDITVSVKGNESSDDKSPVGENKPTDDKSPVGENKPTDEKSPAGGNEITDIESYAEEKNVSEFIEETNANMDSDQIVSLVEEEFGKDSAGNPGDFADEATERVLGVLEKAGVESAEVIRTYGTEQKIQAVKALYETAGGEKDTGGEKITAEPEAEDAEYAGMPVLLFLSAAAALVLILIKTRRKEK